MKKIIFAGVSFLSGFLIVIILSLYTVKRNSHKNGFKRFIKPGQINLLRAQYIKYNSYYLAGTENLKIYLGNYTAPEHILVSDCKNSDTQHLELPVDTGKIVWSALKIAVDSPYLYAFEGHTPALFRFILPTFTPDRLPINTNFSTLVPVSSSSFIGRAYQAHPFQHVIWKQGADLRPVYANTILEGQKEGIFSTDGSLLFDKQNQHLVYLYSYRNQYIVFDTNMAVIYRGLTIDTISTAEISVASIQSGHSLTMTGVPIVVNKYCLVHGGKLFISSPRVADNEDKNFFAEMTVIDVYSLMDRRYQYSFYVEDYKGGKMRDFQISGGYLLTLTDDHLLVYKLNSPF